MLLKINSLESALQKNRIPCLHQTITIMLNPILSTLPVFSLLPVVNNRQQIAALYFQAESAPFSEILKLLHFFQSNEIFERLPGISMLIPVSDAQSIPADLDERLSVTRVNLLVPESHCAQADVQTRLQHFHKKGFRVVVDNFSSKLELAWKDTQSIAVDCSNGVAFTCKHWTQHLHGGWHVAKNLRSQHSLFDAQEAGFRYFSGDYAFVPVNGAQKVDSAARTRLLKLLGLVSRDAETRELEELFRQDPGLSFQLFKLVSSAAFAQTVKVSSFGQAINLLGRRQLQRWLQLLLYARQDEQQGVLNPLMPRAAFRASMMENLCRLQGGNKDEQDAAFMTGMFSLLDVLFGMPLEQVLQPLNLVDDILEALLHRSGKLGAALCIVENADVHRGKAQGLFDPLALDTEDYYRSLTKAYEWVIQVCQDM
jgi:EAL and modified HD-GYP domain-containing signal transduction protein